MDLHTISTSRTHEQIIQGPHTGILQFGDVVTFQARHFGAWQTLTSKVTEADPPSYFCDEMQKGSFKMMRHEHHFISAGDITIMRDVFSFESPFGLLGKAANYLILEQYMRRFLRERGTVLKRYAESGEWREVLDKSELVAYR